MAQGSINNRYDLLCIGGSAGSVEVLIELLPRLRAQLQLAIIIILHRLPGGSDTLLHILSGKTSMPVEEPEEKEGIEQNKIYVAPPDYHLLVEKDHTFALDYSEKIHYSRPAIDATLETAADAFGNRTAGIILSGANADGIKGMQAIKHAGGLTIAQDPAEALVSYMPQQAITQVDVDYIANTVTIAEIINGLNTG